VPSDKTFSDTDTLTRKELQMRRTFFQMLVLCLVALCGLILPACATPASGSSSRKAETYRPSNFLISNQTMGLTLKLEVEDAGGRTERMLADRETFTYKRPETEPIVFGTEGQRMVATFTVTAFERTDKSGPDTLVQVGEPIKRVLRASDLNWFWNVHRSSFGLKEPEPVAQRPATRRYASEDEAPSKSINFVNLASYEVEIFNELGETLAKLKPGERFLLVGVSGVRERYHYQARTSDGITALHRTISVFWDAEGFAKTWRISRQTFGDLTPSESAAERERVRKIQEDLERREREREEEFQRWKEDSRRWEEGRRARPGSPPRTRNSHDW